MRNDSHTEAATDPLAVSSTPGLRRRDWLRLAVLAASGVAGLTAHAAKAPLVEVWKAPTCGCCGDWIRHLQANGFQVKVTDEPRGTDAIRARLGMPDRYASCHTARVGGYVLEGHVPAREIQRLLREKPAALGIAAPGMPVGSPGMDGPAYGGRRDPFDVVLVQRDGTARVYQSYR